MANVFGRIFNNSGIVNSQSSSLLIKDMSIIINNFGGLGIFIGLLIMSWILKSKKQMIQYFKNRVWKFQDFSVIQILCEIIFRESRSSKNAVLAILGAQNFVNLVNNISLQKVQKFIKIQSQCL